jgi:hypothetical protein
MPPAYDRAPRRRRKGSSLSDVLRYVPEGAYRRQTQSATQPRPIPKDARRYGRRRYPVLPKTGPYATQRKWRV